MTVGVVNNWGNLGVTGTITPDAVKSGQFIFALNEPPLTPTSPGIAGEMIVAPGFIYICVATHQWERVATATW